ncbi:MAG TPA: aldo/keto reductase [Bryobacteraceae bacterium]|nr:aldo/keto reductase [Bryobacteraceae bacterium]
MKYRTLGRTGFRVSEIGYGAWGIGGSQWLGGTDDESLKALHRAIELGVNFIDTALAYGDGHSEKLVGQVVRETRQRIYVATKVPPKNLLWPARPGIPISEVFPYDYILRCAHESLSNLKMDTVDLLQLHVWNPEWIHTDDWRRALDDLKRSGKARAVGISINDHQPDTALEIIRTGHIDTVQVIYNIFDQSPEPNLFPLCRQENIGVLARVPLDEGALTGNITPDTTFPPGDFRNEYFAGDRKRQVAEHVAALRRDLPPNGSLPDIALRFVLSNPAVSTVIPGMRSVRHAESNAALSDQGPLPAETMAVLKRHAWEKNFYD